MPAPVNTAAGFLFNRLNFIQMATDFKTGAGKNVLTVLWGEDYQSYSVEVERKYVIKEEGKTFRIYSMLVDECIKEGRKAVILLNDKKIFDSRSYHEQFGS